MTSFSRRGETLSGRLSYLRSFHQQESFIWDIGCDHGFLGTSFLNEPSVREIHLVDPALAVIEKLKDSYIASPKIRIHHSMGQNLKIEKTQSNLIFIAGMGGMEIKNILEALLPQIESSSRIVISPHRKILELRKALSSWKISLSSESVVEEGGQFYQVLVLSPGEGRKVSLFGEDLWRSPVGQRYREKDLLHFSHHRDEVSKAYVEWLKTL